MVWELPLSSFHLFNKSLIGLKDGWEIDWLIFTISPSIFQSFWRWWRTSSDEALHSSASLSMSAKYQRTLDAITPRTIKNITSFPRHQNGHKWSAFTLRLHPQSFLFSYETLGLGEDVYKYRFEPFKMKALSSGRLLQSATQLSPWQLLLLKKCYTT